MAADIGKRLSVTGTNLNTPLVEDLSKTSNIYTQQVVEPANSNIVGNVINLIGNTISVSVETLFKVLGGIVDFGLGLVGVVKDTILGFISGLIGRDLGGLSKLSLQQKSDVSNSSKKDCSLMDMNFGFNGIDLNILGYGLAALLGMLLCQGIKGIFTLLGTIVDLGIATVEVVSSALSDTFKGIFGGNTVAIVNDLALSPFGKGVASNVTNSEGMILNAVKSNTAPIQGSANQAYSNLNNSLNTLTPNWLSDNQEFSLAKVRGNNTISGLASSSLSATPSNPLLSSRDYTSKVLNPTEKISLFSFLS